VKAVVLILFVLLVVVVFWFALGNSGPPARIRRRVVERRPETRRVRRQATYVEAVPESLDEPPEVVEERRIVE